MSLPKLFVETKGSTTDFAQFSYLKTPNSSWLAPLMVKVASGPVGADNSEGSAKNPPSLHVMEARDGALRGATAVNTPPFRGKDVDNEG